MAGYTLINLKELLEQIGEDRTKVILFDFICPQNKDVENFFKSKSIEFSKQGIAMTFLIFASFKKKQVLVGYFTLAAKVITICRTSLSKNLIKKISKFSQYDNNMKRYILSAPLIGQLAKNYKYKCENLITGDELLKFACDKVKAIQGEIGGKVVYLECEDKQNLIQFYESNGFVCFGKRRLDKDELGLMEGEYLVQLLKYLH